MIYKITADRKKFITLQGMTRAYVLHTKAITERTNKKIVGKHRGEVITFINGKDGWTLETS